MPLATKGRVHPSRRISQDLIAMTNAGRSVQHWTTRIRYHARSYCDPEPHGTAEGPGSPGPGPPPPPNARPLGTLTTRVDRGEDRATQRSLPHAIQQFSSCRRAHHRCFPGYCCSPSSRSSAPRPPRPGTGSPWRLNTAARSMTASATTPTPSPSSGTSSGSLARCTGHTRVPASDRRSRPTLSTSLQPARRTTLVSVPRPGRPGQDSRRTSGTSPSHHQR